MTTMNDLVHDVRRRVYGSLSEQINIVAEPYTANADELVLELDVSGITPGMILSSGLNTWYVKGIVVSEKRVLVLPAYENNPAAAAAIGDIVYIRPRMTSWYAFNLLNDEIRRLSSPAVGLYKLGSWEAASDSIYETYTIPEGVTVESIMRVRVKMPSTTDVWNDLPTSAWKYDKVNGIVQLLRYSYAATTLQFIYKAPFVAAASLSDNVQSVCGLTSTMNDIPVLGVAANLLMTTEMRRGQVQTQGDPRRAAEVQQGSNSTVSRQMLNLQKDRIDEEYARLVSAVPIFRGI